jgi:uncharacterized protein YcbK (DUF882 family)
MIYSDYETALNQQKIISRDWTKINNFTQDEFQCPCCGLENIDWEFLMTLDDIRELYGSAMIVNSGCRCPKHNKKIGGAKNSAHIATEDAPSYAADIRITNSNERYKLINASLAFGINRIMVYHNKNIVHLDGHPTLPQGVLCVY